MYFEPKFSWHQQQEEEEEDREANKVICCFAGISLTVAVRWLLLPGA